MSNRATRTLIAAVLGAAVVEYAAWTAMLLFTFDRGGAALAGALGAGQQFLGAVVSPPVLTFVDRLPRRAALGGTYAAVAVSLVVMAGALASSALLAVVAASTLITIGTSVARPLFYASLPSVADSPGGLVAANAAAGLSEGVGIFAGPMLAGFVSAWLGLPVVGWACALIMMVAAILAGTCARLGRGRRSADSAGGEASWAAVLRQMMRQPARAGLFAGFLMAFLVVGSLEILGVAFAHELSAGNPAAGDSAAGTLIGAHGIGMLVGASAAGMVARRSRLAVPIFVALLLGGLCLTVFLGAVSIWLAVLLLCGFGAGHAVTGVSGRTLLQRSTEDGLLSRFFSIQESVALVGMGAGAILAPVLLSRFGAQGAYVVLGAALILTSLGLLPALRILDRASVDRHEEVALLRSVGFLAPLPPNKLERLAARATWDRADAGETLVRQGEPGDAYFVIAAGSASVTVDGRLREHRLGAGDGFGEIALVRDVPRTATIEALETSTLLRIEREDFLEVISGTPSAGAADQVAGEHLRRDQAG